MVCVRGEFVTSENKTPRVSQQIGASPPYLAENFYKENPPGAVSPLAKTGSEARSVTLAL